jgi:hypothetical protein
MECTQTHDSARIGQSYDQQRRYTVAKKQNDELKYLKPMADRALYEWFGDRYRTLSVRHRALLATDVAGIMHYEEMDACPAVMVLDLRIHPATLLSYAQSLAAVEGL